MLKQKIALLAVAAFLTAAGSAGAAPITLTFDEGDAGLVHGSIVNSQYLGVAISAVNLAGGPDLAVAFDSDGSGSMDPDLEFGSSGWAGGNLAPDTRLGNLLIIQRYATGCLDDGICDRPDDQGSRTPGALIFEFDLAVTSFGFDLVDVDSLMAENGSIAFFDGATSVMVEMSSFLAGLELGNNSANRITPFLVGEGDLSQLAQITKVELHFGGSGGLDNVTFEPVPEPSSLALLGLGLGGLGLGTRARPRNA